MSWLGTSVMFTSWIGGSPRFPARSSRNRQSLSQASPRMRGIRQNSQLTESSWHRRANWVRKWVVRNRLAAGAIACALVILIVGLVAVILESKRARDQAEVADARLQEVLRLADVKLLGEYEAKAKDLWPCVPEKAPELEQW